MKQLSMAGITLVVFAFLLDLSLFGQVTTATISGTVRDSSGAIIPGAEIALRNVGTGISRTMATDSQGRYLAPNLSLGGYEVKASSAGFQTEVRTGITLTVGQRAVIDFTLTPGTVAEAVTVTGEAPLVDTATSEVGTLVSQAQISDLPLNGRDYTQLALLQPGVIQYRATVGEMNRGMGVQFSVSGARTNQTGFRLNGLDIADGAGLTPGSATGHNLGVDAIQEFKVLTSMFTAEHGKAAGGVVNMVYKSGTNQLHGSVFEYLRNSALDARNFFDPEDVVPFKRNQFGFSLGGPIRRDRTFFFGNFEGLRERLALTDIVQVLSPEVATGRFGPVSPLVKPWVDAWPKANGRIFSNGAAELVFPSSTRATENYFVVKLDHTFSSSDSISGSYTRDAGQYVTTKGSQDAANQLNANDNHYHYITLQETHVFSPTTLNNFRAGFNRSNGAVLRVPTRDFPKNLEFVPGIDYASISIAGIADIDVAFSTIPDRILVLNSYQWGDTLNLIRGAHSIKAGMEAYRFQFIHDTPGTGWGGQYIFSTLEDFLAARASTFQVIDPIGREKPYMRQSMFGFFLQDDVQIRPGLTLNAGVRYEFVTTPHSTRPIQAVLVNLDDPAWKVGDTLFENPSLKNVAPRVGLAWDLFGNQKTALRAGFGIFHDQLTSYYYLAASGNSPLIKPVRFIDNPPFPNGYAAIASGRINALYTIDGVDYHIQQPYRIQYNFGIQQQLLNKMSLAAYYVGGRGVHSASIFSNLNTRFPSGRTADGRLFFDSRTPVRNPNFSWISLRTTAGDSYYNSLQLVLNQRVGRGVQFQGSYTWSKGLDTGSAFQYTNQEGVGSAAVQNPFEPGSEKGLSVIDARHAFSLNTTYDLPFGNQWSGAAKILGAGWQLSGILTLVSGQPFTTIIGFDNAHMITRRRGDLQRPDLVAGRSNNPVRPGNPDQYFDPTAFTLSPPGTLGNLGRNTMIGPGLAQFDFSLRKDFSLTESKRLEFRVQAFNLFNHPNFRIPSEDNGGSTIVIDSRGRLSPSAGRITRTTTSSRQIQFSLRLEF